MSDAPQHHNHETPHGDEPMVFAPVSILALIGFMLGLHALRALWLGLFEPGDIALLKNTAFVAARFGLTTGLIGPDEVMREIAAGSPEARQLKAYLAQAFLQEEGAAPWTIVTYSFLHAGWEHVIFNSLWLLAFGSPVMQRFGIVPFSLFFCATAASAAALHGFLNPADVSVLVGASGAVSGLTAAALRFAFAGNGFGLGFGPHQVMRPAPPLLTALSDRRVMIFVAIWFGLNLLAGLGIPLGGGGDARIAWEAHVGGFLAGLLLFPAFDPVESG
jgi:membrane associated rhomboid family serine protease